MIHAPPETDHRDSAKRLSTGAFLVSMSALKTLCAKKASQVKEKIKAAHHNKFHNNKSVFRNQKTETPRSASLAKPKQLFTTMSDKAMNFVHRRHGNNNNSNNNNNHDEVDSSEELEFGEGGVWQRTILMGDKCQPLDFSGVIYYDENGKQINELPIRSPRASPLPGYLMRRYENGGTM